MVEQSKPKLQFCVEPNQTKVKLNSYMIIEPVHLLSEVFSVMVIS